MIGRLQTGRRAIGVDENDVPVSQVANTSPEAQRLLLLLRRPQLAAERDTCCLVEEEPNLLDCMEGCDMDLDLEELGLGRMVLHS